MKSAIIGSGIGGLALAIRLRCQRQEVVVFESHAKPGGKIHSIESAGYRFDGGPSLFTMPQYVDELFTLAGKNPRDYFDYKQLDEACKYFWEDGTCLNGFSNPEKFAQEVQRKLRVSQEDVLEYFDHIEGIYNESGKIFLEKSLHKASTWLSTETLKSLIRLRKYDLFTTMNRANKVRLGEPHLVQLFNRFATYNGSNPYKAPGILNVIPWLEHGFGTYFPKGGMRSIPQALFKLATDLGVEFKFNHPVERIIVKDGRASGLIANGEKHDADRVISNTDIHPTYKKLMPEQKAPEKTLSQERSSSALVFYWGMERQFSELGLHNIFFSADYKKEFESLFSGNSVTDDPTVYLNISSKEESADAPQGCENWFVMVNVPSDQGQDWKTIRETVRKHVLKKLTRFLKTNLEPLIKTETTWSPPEIESDTGSFQGALYGTSSNSQFAAFLRHPNFSSSIKNLYFCGGSVHPGGGIPLCLLSAKITTELMAKR